MNLSQQCKAHYATKPLRGGLPGWRQHRLAPWYEHVALAILMTRGVMACSICVHMRAEYRDGK